MLINLLIDLINFLISGIGLLISTLVNLLPNSPFTILSNLDSIPFLNYLNWIIPIGTFIGIIEVWLIAIATYYLISVALRFAKVIE